MKNISFFIFFLLTQSLFAQSFVWVKLDSLNISINPSYLKRSVTLDNNSNPIYSNLLNSKVTYDPDLYGDNEVIKISPDKNIIWKDSLKGKSLISSIACDNQNDIICIGKFVDTLTINPLPHIINSSMSPAGFILKLTGSGTPVWLKTTSSIFQEDFLPAAVKIDGLNNIWLGGDELNGSYIKIIDQNGNFISSFNQINVRTVTDLTIDPAGNIWVVGSTFNSQASFNGYDTIPPYTYNKYVVKYSPGGTAQWIRFVEDITIDETHIVNDVNGNAYISGHLYASTNFGNLPAHGPYWVYDYFLVKMDQEGNFIWLREVPGQGSSGDADVGNSDFLKISGSSIYISGFSRGDLDYGGGNIIYGYGTYDVFVINYDTNGNVQWVKNAGGSEYDFATSVAVDDYGNCYIGGEVGYSAVFDTINVSGEFSNFILAKLTDESATPVEISTFNARLLNNQINLEWTTASESNNRGFEIERKIGSGQPEVGKWERIRFVNGNGTTTKSHFYSFIDKEISSGTYQYRLKQIDFDGKSEYSKEVEVKVNIPIHFTLEQNYPNPFNPSTTIDYSMPKDGNVSLVVFNILGQQVVSLVNGNKKAGQYHVIFDASNLASGVYYYRLQSDNKVMVKKMLLLK